MKEKHAAPTAAQKHQEHKKELTPQEKHAFDHEIISWSAPLYPVHEKTHRWYIIAAIVFAGFLIYAFLTSAWTFAAALIAYAYLYIYMHRRPAKNEKIIISEIGIKEGHRLYPFSNIDCFWIIYNPPGVKQLHLLVKNRLTPEIIIQLNGQNPAQVRNYLCAQIPEIEGREEAFFDILCRVLKL